MISPHQIQVAFGVLNHCHAIELGAMNRDTGRDLTVAETRLKDTAIQTLCEFLNSEDKKRGGEQSPGPDYSAPAQPQGPPPAEAVVAPVGPVKGEV